LIGIAFFSISKSRIQSAHAHPARAFAAKIPAAAQEIPEAKDFPRRAAIELLSVQMGRTGASLAWQSEPERLA
jgi:hypothetical protein